MAHFFLKLLGVPQLVGPYGPAALARRQPLALLAFLALADGPVPRDELAFLFWADAPQITARQRLRRTLSQLRQALELAHGDDILRVTSSAVLFDRAVCRVDACEFLRSADAAAQAAGPAAIGPAEQALAYYEGPLLDGLALADAAEFEQWLVVERERFTRHYCATLAQLVGAYSQAGDITLAIASAERLIEADPLREEAYRRLAQLYAASGQCSAALRQYERCAVVLERELGVDPLPETRVLFDALLHDSSPAMTATPPLARPAAAWGTRRSLSVPYVAPGEEVAQLRAALLAGLGGRPTVACVSGPAGVGKTRLLREVADGLNVAVWLGGGQALGRAVPYVAFLSAVRAALHGLPAHALRALPGLPDLWLAEASRLLPELRLQRPDLVPPPALPPDQAQARLYEALMQLVYALSRLCGGAILVLDDLEQADPASLACLSRLVRQLDGVPLGVVVACRDLAPALEQWHDEVARHVDWRDIRLQALPLAAVIELARLTGVPADIEHLLGPRLERATGGIPFFVLETVRVLQERGVELWSDPAHPLPLPATVREVILERMRSLGPVACQVLEACAVIGQRFAFEHVQVVSGRDADETAGAFDALLVRAFLSEAGTDYCFAHAQIAEAVYAATGAARRRLLHRRAAALLQGRLPESAAALASHLEQAGDAAEAARHWLLAGRRAWEIFAAAEALDGFTRGLAHAADPALRYALLGGREEVLHHLGRREAQQADLDELARLSEALGVDWQIDATRRQGRFWLALNRWGAAEASLRRAVLLNGSGDIEALRLLASALAQQQQHDAAQSMAAAALDAARAHKDVSAQVACLLTLSELAQAREDIDAAEQVLRDGVVQAAQDPATRAQLTATLGKLAYQRGQFEQALDQGERAVRLHQEHGNREGEAGALVLVARCLARLGRTAAAIDAYEQARAGYRAIQNAQGLAAATVNAASLALRIGALERGAALSKEAYELFAVVGDARGLCVAASNLGAALVWMGRGVEAEPWLQQALDRAVALALPLQQAAALNNLGAALLQQGRAAEARDAMERGLELRRASGHVDVCLDTAYLALAYLRVGDLSAADAFSAQAALELADANGVEHPQQVMFARAQVLRVLGRREAAQAALAHARQLLDRSLEALPIHDDRQRYRAMFPFNRDILAAVEHDRWPDPPRLI